MRLAGSNPSIDRLEGCPTAQATTPALGVFAIKTRDLARRLAINGALL